jgi:hypothetical protein
VADTEDNLAAEFVRRYPEPDPTFDTRILATLTFSLTNVSFQVWFDQNVEGIGPIVDRAFSSLAGGLM